jgi:hypothetical protein
VIAPGLLAWLKRMREWAQDPRAVVFPVNGTRTNIAISPEDVLSRPDDEQLLDFIRARLRGAGN